ncbi:T9SS type A sorting domain-containing protein [Riemerella anatipestifer]|uniref:T9SS type A sorting domain-containing protein n=1 Tax=Riemerella anatipestifer TaxID=34085 RepID=UPI0030BE9EBC
MKKILLTVGMLSSTLLFSQNLITNSGLEEWQESCWMGCTYFPKTWKGNAKQSAENPKEGTYSAELGSGRNIEFELRQGIEAGQKYILSYYVYSTGAERQLVHRFRWRDANRTTIATNGDDYTHSVTTFGQWEKVEKEFVAPENAAGFYINVNTSGSGSSILRVDDFKFYKVGNMSVQDLDTQKDISVYVHKKVLNVITNKKLTLKVLNLNGQVLNEKTLISSDNINLNALPHGIYLVLVETDKGVLSKKIRL